MAGYIKLYRKFAEWEWYQDANVTRVFLHLLLSANYEDRRWRGKLIQRGQIVTCLEHLAERLLLSVHQVRTALEKLESTGEIGKQTTNKYTLITICKFDDYQNAEDTECQTDDKQTANECQTDDKQTANECQTDGNQMATTKEYKEINNNNNSSSSTSRACAKSEFEKMKEEDGLIESVMMLNHIGKIDVLRKIDEFKAHCQAGMNEHVSQGDIRRHFRDWVRIRISDEKKQQQYGAKNKQNDRGFFEPDPKADYSAPI